MKTLEHLTLLAWEGPQARAYLVRMARGGMRPSRVILMISPRLAEWGNALNRMSGTAPAGRFCMRVAEAMQDSSNNFHPYRILSQHPKLVDSIDLGMASHIDNPRSLWQEMYAGFSYDRYAAEVIRVPTGKFDNPLLLRELSGVGAASNILFSGGGIVPRQLLDIPGIRMIHVHTGLLPEVRGADVLLWSIVVRGRIGVSAFVMSRGLDVGDVLATKELAALQIKLPSGLRPDDMTLYRALFSFIDPMIRAEFLVSEVLTNGGDMPAAVPQDPKSGRTFHFMHPVLRSSALKLLFTASPGQSSVGAPRTTESPLRRYQRFYESPGLESAARTYLEKFRAKSSLQRLSLMNRSRDYRVARRNPELLALHGRFNRELALQQEEWISYDYGQGWFYQSSPQLGITGLRDTKARVKSYDLEARLKGCSVLEIGCNSGFLSLAIASFASHVTAFDLNPHLIAIALGGREYLRQGNVVFSVAGFEDFRTERQFDVVISFANHHTYDQNTKQSVEDYFSRCHALTRPGGSLLFESHPPEIDGAWFGRVLSALERYFLIEESEMHQYGTFLDRNRTFIVASRRDLP